MVSKVKTSVTVLVAVVVLGAFGAASASAASWKVGGVALSGSAALSAQALADENTTTMLVPTLGLSIVCSGHFFDALKPQIFGSEKAYAEALTFLGCNTTKPPTGCALSKENQAVSTTAVLALVAAGTGEADKVSFAPETKTTLTNIEFNEGDTCSFNGIEPVTGSFVVGLPTGKLELLAQTFTGLGSTEGNNSLQVAGQKAFIEGGRYLLTLASDSKWSFS